MATKKEIKEVLKEMSLTEKQMDEFWKENYDTNTMFKRLTDNGKTWKDLNVDGIRQLPNLRQKELELAWKRRSGFGL